MPTISIKRDLLFKTLGRTYTDDEFANLCFDYGLELDEVTSEKEMITKEQGGDVKLDGLSEEIIYKIEVPANRYDLLCLEGLSRALLIFQNKMKIPKYELTKIKNPIQIVNCKETKEIRPVLVAAVLRGVKLDKPTYESFIDLQDKLHQNICRKRSLASIGTHDLDKIEAPFRYTALKPSDIKFIPLNQTKEFKADELMEFYSSTNNHLKPYLPIIKDLPLYPVIYDKNNVVLSLPPIINGDHSKITLNTKNIFIEITATDLEKASIVLDTVVTMFSQYCAKAFTIEPVKVVDELNGNLKTVYPKLEYTKERTTIEIINQILGIDLDSKLMASLLFKMGMEASESADKKSIEVNVPPTRHDILHCCDLAEDVGIAYGYNNIKKTFPTAVTLGQILTISKLSDQLRFELARCGYTECLTFTLCSKEDVGDKLGKKYLDGSAVELANPKTIEFQVVRTTLLPGLLKTIQSNKKMQLPLKLFEIADVVLNDEKTDTGARNERRLCVVYFNKTSGFELVHGVLDRIMQVLEIPYSPNKSNNGYYIRGYSDSMYLNKRSAEIVLNGQVIGSIGVLHPQVILNYELNQPLSAFEITIQNLI